MKTIVVGIDGGPTSKTAAKKGIALALALDARVHFVTVVRKHEVETIASGSDHWIVDNIETARDHVTDFLVTLGVEVDHTIAALAGSPVKALISEAERVDADLIVIGNADMTGVSRLVGSVGSGVAGRAPCDVLIVKTH